MIVLAGLQFLPTSKACLDCSWSPQVQQDRMVVVALVPHLQDSTARAVVIRRVDLEPREVILLREADGTSSDLIAAIALLQRSRTVDGDAFSGELRMTVRVSAPVREIPRGVEAFLSDALDRLRTAQPRPIPEVGVVRQVTLPLTRFRHRDG